MTISLSASLLRLLLCGMVVVSAAAAPAPTRKPPVVQPHGPLHAQPPLPVPPIPPSSPAAPQAQPALPVEPPKPAEDNTKGSASGLPIPRFVSAV